MQKATAFTDMERDMDVASGAGVACECTIGHVSTCTDGCSDIRILIFVQFSTFVVVVVVGVAVDVDFDVCCC